MNILVTSRLTMRPPVLADSESILSILNDPLVSKHLSGIPHPLMLSDAQDWVRSHMKDSCSYMLYREQLLGSITVHNGAEMPLLNFWLSPRHWGEGYMIEALTRILPLAFDCYNSESIGALIFSDNENSLTILESLGFIYVGDGMLYNPARGEGYPTKKLVLSRSDMVNEDAA